MLMPHSLNADEFVPASAVEQCRLELKQMEAHYTPGELCFWFTMYVWCYVLGGCCSIRGGPVRCGSGVAHLCFPIHITPQTGQIWVGKEADSGAQIAVKDVRGDSVLWLDEQALTATAFIKDGKKRPCSFQTLHHVRKQSPTLRGLSLSGWD